MADSFGLKIGLEGEKEFKKALNEINQSFKVLGSEMKLVSSQFDKNDKSVQALSARNSVLNKEIEAQKQKIDTLRAALQNASDSFGETDRRTQNWQIQLNNAEAALNDMERELSDNNTALEEANANYGRAGDALEDMDSEMDDVTDSADDMGDEIDEAGDAAEKSESKFKGLGTVLKAVGAAMGAVVIAAGAAAVKLGKEVIDAYADYEQLVGGVDTLFKDSSQELQSYAANAYKTAGMSANDYMETVTGFSASLIQSLGGDTEKAVKYADMAITDMSDNANKMGTDMASIQNAYQGFAKQNYTMLDNLKLGYGGTKEEMERLLADAQAISGIEYDISSYADVVDAIHVIQTSMDITGTTAKEAEHTISGSINSMQAAIQNLIVGFGDANADIGMLCGNVVDAFQDVLTNITPVIENIIAALPTALNALIATVGELLPTLLETVVSLFTEVLTTILNLLPSLIPAAVQAVMTIVNALIENLPMLLDAALQLITGLAQGLLDALPVLIAALPDIITAIVDFIIESIPQIIDAGIQLLTSLITALPQIITAIVAAIPQIIDGIVAAVLNAIPQIIQAGIDLLIALIQALPQIISTIVQAIPQIISGIVNALIGNIDKIILAGVQLFVALIKNLPTIIVEIVKAVPQIISSIVKGFASGVSQMASIGLNLIKGIWNGISDAASWLWSKVSGFCSNLMSKIKGFFGIHSPSKEMAWIGDMLTQGLANGIDESAKMAVNAAQSLNEGIMGVMDSLADDMQTAVPSSFNLDADATVRSAASGALGKAASAFTIALNITNFNNYSSEDIRQLTNEVMETASQFAQRKGVVFA